MEASMWFGRPFLIALLLLAFSHAASAEVIELKTGERVEGAFKGADATSVRIEIGNQVLTFKPEQVRAIYYGAAPRKVTTSRRRLHEAIPSSPPAPHTIQCRWCGAPVYATAKLCKLCFKRLD